MSRRDARRDARRNARRDARRDARWGTRRDTRRDAWRDAREALRSRGSPRATRFRDRALIFGMSTIVYSNAHKKYRRAQSQK